ncbi:MULTISPECIES: SDR family oxidoreductase [unclassified Pseudomonas]|uniref:SDR family oxidoreductase n=1 Tax=unclassified Pseudomonas TaxID=196821 RepID=UPI000D361308|nr:MULTISPECIES: SDR family oxidoreductase [unclassified Pseudomonas]RAU45735.1 SDR family NAD(P)-dependent oxidoreductase [Pseudomonas sp. RIT 409]RAU56167.1 SDR family NAD(P)-dependent oxidoreductase [Pseudomonas sp. RIT 412]
MKIIDLLKPVAQLKVVITGGAAGIGAVIAQAFHEVQARVYICDIDAQAVERMKLEFPGMQGGVADVASTVQVDRMMEEATALLGGLDVLVNNAGIAGPTGNIETLAPHEWEATIATNLNSQYYVLRKAIPFLRQSTLDPHIIAMSPVAGRLGYPFRTPYASTKWAIIGLMKSLASELGPDNIRVNAILPGVVAGERMNRVIDARAQTLGIAFDAMRDRYLEKISLRRMVTMEEVAAMALFLSSRAAANISGQAISVDGNVEYL